jgi:beta-galactosidase
MPSVTLDGRSFMIDGRRVWLVSGRVPYARLPRETWGDRIHAAKLAGLNTIETPVFWNRHEVRPGRFDFTGDNDLRHFVDLVGKAGMYCILGLGPFIDSAWEFGGLPPWLAETSKGALRTTGGPFLEASSRFITAVADQIRGWQVTSPGTAGPVLVLQCEHEWTCGHEGLAHSYLGELTRYIREAGLNLPIVNANNLWQGVEGQIDGWAGGEDLLPTMRQLVSVRPTQPRLVIDMPLANPDVWGREQAEPVSPWMLQRRLAEVLAGGGQFNISTFCGGTNFGFYGGRLPDGPDSFATTSAEAGAVITADGRHGPAWSAVRRLAHAASRFGRVFANLDPAYQPISLRPPAALAAGKKGRASASCPAVVHCVGPQGGAAFLFRDDDTQLELPLLLPEGSTLPVPFGQQLVVWCLFGVNITARARLDYANICALGSVGQVLVCFGPAGATAHLSVNGSPIEAQVPTDASPAILDHEGLTLVILNEEAADSTFMTEDAVYVGVAGLAPDGSPLPLPGSRSSTRIGADGKHKQHHAEAPRSRPGNGRPTLGAWSMATTDDYADGTSARYAAIDGPADLARLGSAYGYGWYRLGFKADATRRAHLVFPFSADRLHLFCDGKAAGVTGVGPGAEREAVVGLKKGQQQLVVLVENFGRFSGGANLSEHKGLFGPVYEVEAVKPAKPKIISGPPVNILEFRSPLWEVSEGDTTSPERLTWVLQHRRRTPLLLSFDQLPASALLLLNDKPVAYLDRSGPRSVVLTEEQLSRGNNTIQIALAGHSETDEEYRQLASGVRFAEGTVDLTTEGEMAFAKWEAPAASAFSLKHSTRHGPAWWRTSLSMDRPADVYLEPLGLTKGQAYVNGRHLGRYFVATAEGKAVPPQSRYLIPGSWLKAGESNELTVFDEHGGNPSRCRVTV